MSTHEIQLDLVSKKKIFPPCADNIMQQLRITDTALFSTTPFEQSLFIRKILFSFYTKTHMKSLVLTDAGGCIGGNTFTLLELFSEINFVEISALHVDIFRHNLELLFPEYVKKVKIINDNYLNTYSKLHQDVVFLDPPWGGQDYNNHSKLKLYYTIDGAKVSVADLINDHLIRAAELVIIKVPKNFDFQDLLGSSKAKYSKVITLYKKMPYSSSFQHVLYCIIVLSNITPFAELPSRACFAPLGYKNMKYTV